MDKGVIQSEIESIEADMMSPHFWDDKADAQTKIKRLQELKDILLGFGKYDKGNAVLTLYAGAGGDDAEDFVRMLFTMYIKYIENKGWTYRMLHEHQTEHGGYRNITIEINGKQVYGNLKHESGVHRLVRISPFNANQKRHTSFAMVEVIPRFERIDEFALEPEDLKIEFSRSSGPGGQNVNKRETAVRIVHMPTNISVAVDSERTQERNRDKAIELLSAKIYTRLEEERIAKESGMHVSKTTDNEWGSQIRSYVLHPYKMVKDHRTNHEIRDVERVLEGGDLDEFIKSARELRQQ